MNNHRVAIIGLGGVAQIMHLPALLKTKDVEITAVCDIDFNKAKNVGKKYGVKNIYKDVDLMLKENENLKSAIIAVSTDMHSNVALKCIDAGLNVFIEKPIARNYKEALKIVEAAEKKNSLLMVGMNNRFRGDIMMQRSFVKAGEIGNLFFAKAGWLKTRSSYTKWFLEKDKSGGGVFLDNGIVMLDIGMWMFNFPEVKSVSAINFYHNTRSVEDSNFTMIRFNNNSAISIEVSWSFLRGGEFYYCNVYGDKGSSSINPLRIFKKMDVELLEITPKTTKILTNIEKSSFDFQMKHFIGAAKGIHKLVSTGKEAIKIMQIVDAVYKSAKSGKEVLLKS